MHRTCLKLCQQTQNSIQTKRNKMAICKILFFLLALCVWCGKCEVFYKRVGDEVSMKCGVDSNSDIDWKFNDESIFSIKGKSGTKRKGSSHIAFKASASGDTLKVPRLETRDSGNYFCRQSGKHYTVRVVSAFVKPGPVLLQSSNAELHCDITGDPNTEVQWLRPPNGEEYKEKKQVIQLKSVTSKEAGQWTCLVKKDLKLIVALTVVGLQTTAVNASKGDNIELPCSLPQSVSQRVVGGRWKADHLPKVSFPTLTNTAGEGLHWNGNGLSKVNFTTGQLSTNFDVTLKNVQSSDEGTFVCTVEFDGGVSLSVETTLRVMDKPSGEGLPCNLQSEIAKLVEEILGMANSSICGIADALDHALLKLKKLKRCVDDAGASPSDTSSPVSSQDISPCPPDKPSSSQDTGFAESVNDDIESLERKKLNLQIKLLENQNEYYALKLKKIKEQSMIVSVVE
ncbi:tyrosine-protein kinase-like otk isoform X2 [Cyprinus carpio]|uniref:Tyrosine-protein kinase-like otk isoform X2 n=1 Tax=Cyprinus carpio TaxID=7962 RepID=A0A9Q9X788_CYPCA|nr:tyrosine-protein kinase-like otk isoform X2 [Cyprinus carpio]